MDLVTGASGFIGSHLVESLLSEGRKVRAIDLKEWPYEKHENLESHIGDIRHPNLIPKIFAGCERVFHLAALADIVPSISDPDKYFHTNVSGTLNVLQQARAHSCKKFIYAASSSCYGIPFIYPTSEYCQTDPQYPYALTKYMGEQLVMHWSKVYGMDAISLRLFNVYGLRSRTHGAYGAVFGTFLAQLANKKALTVVGDGEQQRDFVHVHDVVHAFKLAAESNKAGIFNIGYGDSVSVNRVVELLGATDIVNIPKRPGEPNKTHADITRAERDLGWFPVIPIEDGVEELRDHAYLYQSAPVWTPETIEAQTKEWFECLKHSA